jgi:hypothetical protein
LFRAEPALQTDAERHAPVPSGEPVPADVAPLLTDIREIINRGIKKWL